MIHSQFETKLYEHLDTFFQSYGFGFLPDQKQFRKFTQNGFQNIIFSISEAESVFWVEVNFGVRFEFIEQIAQQFLNNSFGYRPAANTLVMSVGKFSELKYFRYKVENQTDFEKITSEIEIFFEQKGFAFLHISDSLGFIEETLNDSPTMPCRYLYNQIHRCFKGIIAAKLNNNHNFATLTTIYRHFLLKNGTDQDLINYERLIAFLYHYNPN